MTKVDLLIDKKTNFYFHVLCISCPKKGYSREEYNKKYRKIVSKKVINIFKKIYKKEIYKKFYYCKNFEEAKEKLKNYRKKLEEIEKYPKNNFERVWSKFYKKLKNFRYHFKKFWDKYERKTLKNIENITGRKFKQNHFKFYLTLPIYDAFENFYGGKVVESDNNFYSAEVLIHEIVHINLAKLIEKIKLPKSKRYALEELLTDLITFSVCKNIFGEKKTLEICFIKGEHRHWLDYLFLWELFLNNKNFDKFVDLLVYDFKTKRISFIAD